MGDIDNIDRKYSGSDEVMGAGELKYAQTATFEAPLPLENGGELPGVTVVYETYGKLSPAKDNTILICHAQIGRASCRERV